MNEDSGASPNADNKSGAMPTKQCSKCRQPKPLTEFHKNKTASDGLQAYCKVCHKDADSSESRQTYRAQYYSDHKEKTLERSHAWSKSNKARIAKNSRAYHYRTYFNLTEPEVQAIVEYQHGCCAMCGRPLSKPHIDHSHVDGLIRGALCWPCNRLLGLAHDNPVLLGQGITYLANPPATQALGAPRYGLPGRVGTKKQRKLAKKLAKTQNTA